LGRKPWRHCILHFVAKNKGWTGEPSKIVISQWNIIQSYLWGFHASFHGLTLRMD
jgi:hypothetical protein